MRKRRLGRFFEVRPAECAGSLGGIIGGYKDAKIAGETRTRALGIPVVYLARRPWWGGGSLRAFRRAGVENFRKIGSRIAGSRVASIDWS